MTLRKYEAIGLFRLRIILKNEVHTDSFQLRITLDLNRGFAEPELLFFALAIAARRLRPLENEDLIWGLLVLDQVSACDHG